MKGFPHWLATAAVAGCFSWAAAAQTPPIIVTVLGHHDAAAPNVAQDQVQLEVGHAHPAITQWQACSGADARLELAVVIDDDIPRMGSRLVDIRNFILQLPPTTAVGLVYLHSGTIEIVQGFTVNHAVVTRRLRDPLGEGGISPSPFASLQELLSKWPQHPGVRRELVLFSSGIDRVGGIGSNNPTFQTTLAEMVRDGVVVYSLFMDSSTTTMGGNSLGQEYGASAGTSLGSSLGRSTGNEGNVNLTMLAAATGGEAYSRGDFTLPRFTPYLNEIAARLQSQYWLGFSAPASSGSAQERLKVEVKGPGLEVTAPQDVITGP